MAGLLGRGIGLSDGLWFRLPRLLGFMMIGSGNCMRGHAERKGHQKAVAHEMLRIVYFMLRGTALSGRESLP